MLYNLYIMTYIMVFVSYEQSIYEYNSKVKEVEKPPLYYILDYLFD